VTLASGQGEGDALPIRANARVLGATLKAGESLTLEADPARHIYLVPATGAITVNGIAAQARDGIAITGETGLTIHALDEAELVLVDAR
jgi:redox-sensitive bicupin YhaK (pirin superfamily)